MSGGEGFRGPPKISNSFPQISGELSEANIVPTAGFPSPDYLDGSPFSSQELGSEAQLAFLPQRQAGSLLECGEERSWAVMSSLSEPSKDSSPVGRSSPASSLPSVWPECMQTGQTGHEVLAPGSKNNILWGHGGFWIASVSLPRSQGGRGNAEVKKWPFWTPTSPISSCR